MKRSFLLCWAALLSGVLCAQDAPKPYGVLPTKRQFQWHETEMYCIIREVALSELGLSKKGWKVLGSAPGSGKPELAIDERVGTMWSTRNFKFPVLHVTGGNGVTIAELGVRGK